MLTLTALIAVTVLSVPPAAPAAPTELTVASPAAEFFLPDAIPTALPPQPPPNCSVTCWSTGQTFYAYVSSMNRCGNVGDEKCGVCNWDGYYNGILFANC